MNMQLPSRSYFYLEELAQVWGVQVRDLLDFALCDALQCSTLVTNARVLVPDEAGTAREKCVSGLQRIVPEDLIEVIRTGVASIRQLRGDKRGVLCFADGQADLEVAMEHILVSREDRSRFEVTAGQQPPAAAQGPATFQHRPDYYEVILGSLKYSFGPAQAGVVRKLHEAFLKGEPWVHKGELTKHMKGRIVDLFKRKKDPSWRHLIIYDGKGKWRLTIDDAERLASNRAYRHVVRMFRRGNGLGKSSVPPRPTTDHL